MKNSLFLWVLPLCALFLQGVQKIWRSVAKPMTDRLTITLAQLNPVVGAITGNIEKVRGAREKAAIDNADPVSYTHLTLPTKRIV